MISRKSRAVRNHPEYLVEPDPSVPPAAESGTSKPDINANIANPASTPKHSRPASDKSSNSVRPVRSGCAENASARLCRASGAGTRPGLTQRMEETPGEDAEPPFPLTSITQGGVNEGL